MEERRVTDSSRDPGASGEGAEVAGAQGGVSSQEEIASQGSGDSVETQEIEELRSQLVETQRNISRLQSTYDRKLSETEQQYQQQLREKERALRQKELEGKDDVERLAFENQWLQEDMQELQQKLRQREQRDELMQIANEWADEAISVGIDPTKIDRSDPQATLDSSLRAILSRAKGAGREASGERTTVEEQPKTQRRQERQEERPPSVLTEQSGRTDTGPVTWASTIKQLNEERRFGHDNWTREQVVEAVRRGQLDRSVVDNIIRSRAEAYGEDQS